MHKDKMSDEAVAQTMRVLLIVALVAHTLAVGVMLLSLNVCISTTIGMGVKLLCLLLNVVVLRFCSGVVSAISKTRLFVISKRRYPVDKEELTLFLEEDKASR